MTDAELNDAISELNARLIAGVASTTVDGVSTVYQSPAELRAELRRLRRIRAARAGCCRPNTGPFRPAF